MDKSFIKSILDIDIRSKRIFYRVDYNVPILNNRITDDYRIRCTLPTLKHLISANPQQIIIASHLGRPKTANECSLSPIHTYLQQALRTDIQFTSMYSKLEGKIVLLENLRHYKEETKDLRAESAKYYKFIKDNCDIIVNDGFGVCHRWCGSINGIERPVYAGLLMKKELEMCSSIESSDLIIIGGKKVSDKLKLIKALIKKTKSIFFTGAMCYPLIKYRLGENVGANYVEEVPEIVKEIYEEAERNSTEIILPMDFIGMEGGRRREIKRGDFKEGEMGRDVGPETLKKMRELIKESKIIFWNGPPGIFEQEEFSAGTREIIAELYEAEKRGQSVIMGGGDTVAAVNKFRSADDFSKLSKGGGALLAVIEGSSTPGVDVLQK